MEFLKKNKVLIAIVLSVLILVLMRSLGTNHFKSDAIKWAEPSISRSNFVSTDQVGSLKGEKLIINLDQTSGLPSELKKASIDIPAVSILNKNNLKIIRNYKGTVLLFSAESSVSSRIWMIFSQMGFRNLYILTTESDNEVLKYKFRSDSLARPEF
jgi:hypothetical protein